MITKAQEIAGLRRHLAYLSKERKKSEDRIVYLDKHIKATSAALDKMDNSPKEPA